ncbi:hypothetical protein FGG78_38230, partial [Thioclava sp. BHET1]
MQSKTIATLLVIGAALALFPHPSHSAEHCHSATIDGVGTCHHRAFAKRAENQELRGVLIPAPSAPAGVDGNLLATELARATSTGRWHRIGGTPDQWALEVRAATVGPAPEFALRDGQDDSNLRFVALVQLVAAKPGGKITVKLLGETESLVAGTDAEDPDPESGQTAAAAATGSVPCVDPEALDHSEYDSSGGYPDIAGGFHWLRLSASHTVLAAEVSRTEGYAGGGGTFT